MKALTELEFLSEPELRFGFDQAVTHPKDGLTLFGPHKKANGSMRIGLVSTPEGKRRYSAWVQNISKPIHAKKNNDPNHTPFPGFEAVFGIGWPTTPIADLQIDLGELHRVMHIEDRHQAIYQAVSLYASVIEKYLQSESEVAIDLWMVIVPEFVYALGRPKSTVLKADRQKADLLMDKKTATRVLKSPSLFEADNKAAEIYLYELNSHNQ